jgi:hypothetical protein
MVFSPKKSRCEEADMDQEFGRTHMLGKSTSCVVPELTASIKAFGMTCQRIFESAYVRIQEPPTYGRAVFAKYLSVPLPERKLPPVVERYCAKRREIAGGRNLSYQASPNHCSACMLTAQGTIAFMRAYEMIQPDVTLATLRESVEKKELISTDDQNWLDLLESGALANQSEGWEDLARQEDEAFEDRSD